MIPPAPPDSPLQVRVELVESSKPTGIWVRIKDLAPLVTPVVALFVSVVSVVFVIMQNSNTNSQVASEARKKMLDGVTVTDPLKRQIAASSVIFSGSAALPAVRMLLTGSPDNVEMRKFGIEVTKGWMAAGDRTAMVNELIDDATADVESLRVGAYEALWTVSGSLRDSERDKVLNLIRHRFGGGKPVETNLDAAYYAVQTLPIYPMKYVRSALVNILELGVYQAVETSLTMAQRPVGPLTDEDCSSLVQALCRFKPVGADDIGRIGDVVRYVTTVCKLAKGCNQ